MPGSIVVGTDGSDAAGDAVREAVALAAALGAALDVVCAYEPAATAPVRPDVAQPPGDAEWVRGPREDAEAHLAAAAEAARAAGVALQTFAREGDPADAVLDVAEERGARLVVVGHKGRTGARRFLLGSVPSKVAHHAPCSVLIVRTG